LKSFQTYFYFR